MACDPPGCDQRLTIGVGSGDRGIPALATHLVLLAITKSRRAFAADTPWFRKQFPGDRESVEEIDLAIVPGFKTISPRSTEKLADFLFEVLGQIHQRRTVW